MLGIRETAAYTNIHAASTPSKSQRKASNLADVLTVAFDDKIDRLLFHPVPAALLLVDSSERLHHRTLENLGAVRVCCSHEQGFLELLVAAGEIARERRAAVFAVDRLNLFERPRKTHRYDA